jgi:DNA-binding HxlR family transcriptional regulator
VENKDGYGQFCPVAMAAEVLCSRWTILLVRELLCGSTRFNDIRRGVPKMSPTLLSKRLKELEQAGVIESAPTHGGKAGEYKLTRAGRELESIVMGLGCWGQRWVKSHLSIDRLDPSLLMWDLRRRLNPTPLLPRRCTLKISFADAKQGQREWWLVIDEGKVDLCNFDPGHEIDLYVASSVRALTSIWMGLSSVKQELEGGNLELMGDQKVARSMQSWLGLSAFAKEKSLAA